mgnify:CR=1 FL=1
MCSSDLTSRFCRLREVYPAVIGNTVYVMLEFATGDAAGQKAAMKAYGEDQRWASQSFVAVAREGMDPCDLRLRDGDAAVRDLVESAVPMFEFAVRTTLEQRFARIRVRGEVSGFKRHSSGHLYFDLKDSEAVLAAVCWRGTAVRLPLVPDDGMEVICTGRITGYGRTSRYQMVVEDIAIAGEGALLKMIEDRRKRLAAEGLFDVARKRPIPYLPEVIGVITSPSGAVIRDILHRLGERFPRRVIVWPVAVQGEGSAQQVAAAIAGFNALSPDGAVPRPDLLIVARGGGSLEDLMAFNDEGVVRAAAASRIPLISAVGHETDTTLIDFASDLRCPTPTAAAEKADRKSTRLNSSHT